MYSAAADYHVKPQPKPTTGCSCAEIFAGISSCSGPAACPDSLSMQPFRYVGFITFAASHRAGLMSSVVDGRCCGWAITHAVRASGFRCERSGHCPTRRRSLVIPATHAAAWIPSHQGVGCPVSRLRITAYVHADIANTGSCGFGCAGRFRRAVPVWIGTGVDQAYSSSRPSGIRVVDCGMDGLVDSGCGSVSWRVGCCGLVVGRRSGSAPVPIWARIRS